MLRELMTMTQER
ncbi:Protein of unknown function [Pyronema omphalodes CBS 100304]|uniref:Uncharacterized protein n=1 Tax=Pyronema omphalodes (strain CBS 100304) TaxID=1076935 RepID=U4LAL4_PYROM|nr:Protein of unknown function [Pyronema omphalodes CBS 100304]